MTTVLLSVQTGIPECCTELVLPILLRYCLVYIANIHKTRSSPHSWNEFRLSRDGCIRLVWVEEAIILLEWSQHFFGSDQDKMKLCQCKSIKVESVVYPKRPISQKQNSDILKLYEVELKAMMADELTNTSYVPFVIVARQFAWLYVGFEKVKNIDPSKSGVMFKQACDLYSINILSCYFGLHASLTTAVRRTVKCSIWAQFTTYKSLYLMCIIHSENVCSFWGVASFKI